MRLLSRALSYIYIEEEVGYYIKNLFPIRDEERESLANINFNTYHRTVPTKLKRMHVYMRMPILFQTVDVLDLHFFKVEDSNRVIWEVNANCNT